MEPVPQQPPASLSSAPLKLPSLSAGGQGRGKHRRKSKKKSQQPRGSPARGRLARLPEQTQENPKWWEQMRKNLAVRIEKEVDRIGRNTVAAARVELVQMRKLCDEYQLMVKRRKDKEEMVEVSKMVAKHREEQRARTRESRMQMYKERSMLREEQVLQARAALHQRKQEEMEEQRKTLERAHKVRMGHLEAAKAKLEREMKGKEDAAARYDSRTLEMLLQKKDLEKKTLALIEYSSALVRKYDACRQSEEPSSEEEGRVAPTASNSVSEADQSGVPGQLALARRLITPPRIEVVATPMGLTPMTTGSSFHSYCP